MTPYYKQDGITIYLGDNREVLPFLGRFDLLLTDPPYGIERFKKGFGNSRFHGHGCEKNGILWDVKPDKEFLAECMSHCGLSIIWGANNFSLPASEYFLVWDKEQTVDNFASAELAYTNAKVPAKVFRFSIHRHNQIEKVHPTQKPESLMMWCLSQVPEAATILDPWMGSGTTLVAAKQRGLQATGIEINEAYAEIAVRRLAQGILIPD